MLTITLKKRSDGAATLSCTRADGTSTWQTNAGDKGHFFVHHDLTHYAVETELGHTKGFYGLVAAGWELTDFGSPWPRGPLPSDLDPSELIVGFLDTERALGVRWSTAELAPLLGANPPPDDAQLARIRGRRDALFAQWDALPTGETLELPFPHD